MSRNYDIVEGVWNGFIFKRIELVDYPKVLEHITKYFLREEPTCELLGWSEEFGAEMCHVIKLMLDDNLSFLAMEQSSGEIAGVRVSFCSKSVHLDEMEIHEPQTEALLNGIDLSLDKKKEVMACWNVDSYVEFFVASTDPRFRNRGLAMEMYQRSLKFFKAEGFKLVKCIFTSSTSRRAAVKLGFEEVFRIHYKDMLDKNGEFVFPPSKITPEHYATAMVKYLL